MKLQLVAKNYQVNQNITEVVEKKITKLDKYFDDETLCKVYLKKENARVFKMEIEINGMGYMLRAQTYADNFYDAIDLVIPKLEKQIYKHRSKFEKQLKTNSLKTQMFNDDELRPIKLVKTKKFKLEPMGVDEAMEEFELLGHNFYVFLNKDNGKVNVLYLRDDGDVGLIDPEI